MSFFYQIVSWTSTSFEVSGNADYPGSQVYPGQRIRVQDNAQAAGATPPENNNYDFIVDSLGVGTPSTTVINIKTSGVPSGYLTSVPTPTLPATRFVGLVAGKYEIRLTKDCTLLTTILPFEVDGADYRCVDIRAGSPYELIPGGSPLQVIYGSPLPSCSLDLPGRGTLNYGELILEDMVRMLENFADDAPPISPLIGQIWYDTNASPVGPYVYTEGSPTWDPIQTESVADTNYLRLDTTNDPLTNDLQIDGDLYIQNGTAADPAYSFSGDPNTGMWLSAGDTLNFSTGGVERVEIDSTSVDITVPIRTSSGVVGTPSYSFTSDPNTGLYSIGADQLGVSTGGTLRLTLSTTAITSTLPILGQNGTATAPAYSFSGDTNTGLYSIGADQLGISTGGTLRLTVSSTAITPTLPIHGQDGTVGAPAYSFSSDTDIGMYRTGTNEISFSTAGVRRLTVESNGTLNVAGTVNYETLVTSDDDIPNKKYVDGLVGVISAAGAGGEIQFNAGSPGGLFDATPNLKWDGSNLIVTGTGSPQVAIETFGDIQVNSKYSFGSAPNDGMFYDIGGPNDGIVFNVGGSEQLRIKESGTLSVPTNYETSVTSDNDIPNRLWITQKVRRRNILINGNFNIWQRGISFSSASGLAMLTTDRWWLGCYNEILLTSITGEVTVSQSTTTPDGKSLYSVKVLVDTAQASLPAGGTIQIGVPFEGYDVQPLGFGSSDAKSITVSFWVRANHTGTYSVVVRDGGVNHASVQRHFIRTFTINAPNVWEFKTVTIPGDVGAGLWNKDSQRGMQIHFGLGAGSSLLATPNVWGSGNATGATGQTNILGTLGREIYFSRVQIEEGDVSTDFESRTITEELSLCQRYFQKSYPHDVTPSTSYVNLGQPYFYAQTTEFLFGSIIFPVEMRTTPSIQIYSPQNGNVNKVENDSETEQAGTVSSVEAGATGISEITMSAGGLSSVGVFYQFHYTADAEV